MIKYAREIIKGINNNTVLEGQNSTPTYFFFFFFSSISRPVRPYHVLGVLRPVNHHDYIKSWWLTGRKTPSYLLISRPVCKTENNV